jgi:uncharacterized delta-60 repeat protein
VVGANILKSWLVALPMLAVVACGVPENSIEVKTAREAAAANCDETGKCVKDPAGLVLYNSELVTENFVLKRPDANQTLLTQLMNLIDEPKLLVTADKLEPLMRGVVIVREFEPCDSPKGIEGTNPTASKLRQLKEGRYKACIAYIGEGIMKKAHALAPVDVDTTPPYVSGAISVASVTYESGIVKWSKAADNLTLDGNLSYSVYLSTTQPLNTLDAVKRYGTKIPGDITDSTSYALVDLSEKTLYHAAVKVSDEAGNESLVGSTNFPTPAADVVPPSVSITSNREPGPTNNSDITLTFTFSEAVSGFDAADILITGANKGAFTANSSSVYSLALTSESSLITANVSAGVATDAAGNGNLAANQWNIVYDATPPTVGITSNRGTGPTNESSILLTFTFSEPVTGFDASDVSLTNSLKSTFTSISNTEYTLAISATGAVVSATLLANSAVDSAANGNLASTPWSINYDNSAPTVAITSDRDPGPTNNSSITLTFNFSEAITGFDAADITVNNATKGAFASTSSTVYTLAITPTASAVSASVAANSVTDSAANGNLASTPWSITYDNSAPTVAITSDRDPGPTNNSAITLTFTFSEAITGFDAADITVNNATKGAFASTSSTVYTLVITPTASAVSASVAANSVTDSAANGNLASTPWSITYDNSAPTVAITSDRDPGPTNNSAITLTFTFSEAVTGFDGADVSVTNASKGTFTATSSTVYTLAVTPTGSAVSASVAANSAVDSSANGNLASTPWSITYDNSAPTVAITSDRDPGPTNNSAITLTFTFSEAVTGFDAADVSVTNATKGTFIATSSTVYSLAITPTGSTVSVSVAANSALDSAANGNLASTPWSITYDNSAPTVAITSNRDPGPTNNSSITLTFTFSEAVTGFDATDVSVTNATKGIFTPTSATVYTLAITPTASAVSASVAANAAIDASSNGNLASTPWSITYDNSAPTVAITSNRDPGPTNNASILMTFTFSEAVTGFDATDVTVNNASKGAFTATSATVYSLAITPTASAVSASVAANSAVDSAANGNLASTPWSITYDNSAPTVVITSDRDPGPTNNSAITLTFTFSEAVTGFDAADVSVTNASKGTFTATSSTVYTLAITPTASAVSASVAANSAVDSSANGNLASTPWSITYDNSAPTVAIASDRDPGPTNNSAITLTFTFSEAVTGFDATDVSVTNASKGAFTATSATVYTLALTATGSAVTANVGANAATDASGNGNTAATQWSITYDNSVPTVAITSNRDPGPTNNSAITLTFTFSEGVTGFDATDVSVTNASKGTFTATSSTVYTLALTATGSAVSASVAANSGLDSASNGNLASTPWSITYDNSAPTVAITSDRDPGPTNNSAITLTFTFSEAVTGFDATDVSVTNATKGTFTATSSTVYTLALTATGSAVTANVAANAATDSAGNGNAAASQWGITYDNVSPTVAITSNRDPGPTNNSAITLTFTFSESVTGFDATDVSVTNATKGTFTATSSTVYTLALTATGSAVSASVAANSGLDSASNGNIASTPWSITYDNSAPTVAITSNRDPGPTNNSSIALTFTFSEAVTGFDATDVSVTNAIKGAFTATSSTVYTLALTATGSAVSASVAANSGLDSASNGNIASTPWSITYDNSAPTVAITSNRDPGPTNNSSIALTFTFSEAVTGFDATDVSVTNAIKGAFTATSSTVYTLALTATGSAVSASVAANSGLDSASNGNIASTPWSITYDNSAPTVAITSNRDPGPTNNSSIALTFTFSEAVTGFDATDVTVANATKGSFTATSSTVYALALTATGSAVTANVGANAATDASGNGNTAATQWSITYDNSSPTVAITSNRDPGPTNNSAITLTFTFSEAVTGFDATDVTVNNATKSTFTATSSAVYTLALTPTGSAVSASVAANSAVDSAANGNLASTPWSITYDNSAPTVAITSNRDPGPTNNSSITLTFTFSEAVTGFDATDVTVNNASKGAFTATSATVYSLAITPTASAVSASVAANAAIDASSNGNLGSGPWWITYDNSAPTVAITSNRDPGPTNNSSITLTFTFSEAVTGFDATDVAVTNATKGIFTATSSTVYTLALTPTASAVSASVAANSAVDSAANGNLASTPWSITYDNVAPTVAITSNRDPGPTNNSSITLTFTFSEAVTGFDATDVSVTNATKSTFTATSSTVYTLALTPTGSSVSASVTANSAVDSSANGNLASTPWSITYDNSAPTVAITSNRDPGPTNKPAITLTFTFSEAVTGFDATDVSVTNATKGTFTATSSTVYTLALTATGSAVTANVAANAATDSAGNGNTAASQWSITYDNSAPTVAITSNRDPGPTNNSAITLTFTFSEGVTGFDATDVSVTNATKGTFTATSSTVYTLAITPTASAVSASVAANSAVDSASNGNAASTPWSITYDNSAPTVAITSNRDPGPTNNSAITLTFTFSEGVTGFDATDVSVTNATKGTFTATSSTVYTLAITPTASAVSASVAANSAVDSASNGNAASTPWSITYDNSAPTVAITSNRDPGPTNNSAITLTFTFSEGVTGFDATDVSVTNATKGTFTATSSTIYTLALTATGSAVSASVAANSAIDSASNGNVASTPWSITYDNSAPTVAITSNRDPGPTNNSAITLTFTFSEAVTGFDATDVAVTNATKGTFTATSSAVYTLALTPTGSAVSASVAANSAVDSSANGNLASTPWSITYDNSAPTVAITSNRDPGPTNNSAITLTFTFSEAVTGFDATDVSVTNATKGTFTATSSTVYTLALTATGSALTANVAANAATDSAGNGNTAATQWSITYDNSAPTVAITSNRDPGPTNNSAITLTFTFSKPVTGFDASDVVVTNASKGTFTATSSSVYTLAITPTASLVSASVAANSALDAASNGNIASTPWSITYDNVQPTVAITSSPAAGPTNIAAMTLTFTFSEAVTGFDASDVAVTNASKGAFTATSSTVYTLAITATGASVSASVPANSALDSAANGNIASMPWSISYDNSAPTVAVTSNRDPGPTNNASITLSFTFSEAVTGFDAADVAVTNASKGVFTAVSSTSYSLIITPSGTTVSASVPSNSAVDSATNGNMASTPWSITYDNTAPVAPVFSDASKSFNASFTTTIQQGIPADANFKEFRYTTSGTDPTCSTGTVSTAQPTSVIIPAATTTVKAVTCDFAGNISSVANAVYTFDVTPPNAPSVSGVTPSNVRPTWTWASGGAGGNGTYRYKLNSSDLTTGATQTTSLSFQPASDLTAGVQTLYVQERDAAGNWSSSGSFAITVDATAPNAPAVTSPLATLASSRVTWNWTSGGNGGSGTYRYKLNSNDFTSGSISTTELKFTASSLTNGSHTLFVQEVDAVGNWSASGSTSVTVAIPSTGPYVIAGNNNTGYTGDGELAVYSEVHGPTVVRVNSSGDIFIADTNNSVIRKIAASNGVISTYAQGFASPSGLAIDINGDIYVSDFSNAVVMKIAAVNGGVSAYAGSGSVGNAGDGEPAQTAQLNQPTALAFDGDGNLIILDSGNGNIRKVDKLSNTISTIAGGGIYYDDNVPPNETYLEMPSDMAVAPNGDIYIAEVDPIGAGRIRKISAVTGLISTVAGGNGDTSDSGDGGQARLAGLGMLSSVAVDNLGHVLVGNDFGLRRIDSSTGIISTVYSGSGISSLSFGPTKHLYAALRYDHQVMKFNHISEVNCSDGVDNDSDGLIDLADSECKTVLNLTFDGQNGSLNFKDVSAYGNSVVRSGGVQISTAQSKFGGSSAYFGGSSAYFGGSSAYFGGGSYITVPSNSVFELGTGDFTVEFWERRTQSGAPFYGLFNLGTYEDGILIRDGWATDSLYVGLSAQDWDPDTRLINNKWHHVALVRTAGNVSLYVDGVAAVNAWNRPVSIVADDIIIGTSAHNTGESFYGYIDDVKVTRGTNNGPASAPTFSIAAGAYGPPQSVALSSATSGATIYYTTDGSDPTPASAIYTNAINVSANTTIKAIAVKPGYIYSPVASATYTINGSAATPTFSVASGTYGSTQNVTISSATAGALIYYTTNNTAPTTSSTQYSAAVSVSSSMTLKAIAVKTGFSNSGVATASYVIDTVAPVISAVSVTTASPGTTRTPSVTFTSNEVGSFQLFGVAGCGSGSISSSASMVAASNAATTASLTVNSTTSIYVKANDTVGNTSCVLIGNYIHDNTAPVLPVIADTSRSFNASFTTSIQQGIPADANFKEFRYTITGTDPTCSTGMASSTQPTSVTILAATTTLKAISCDLAGNISPVATSVYTYDVTPPNAPTVTGITPTSNTTPTWSWTSGGGGGNATYRYRLNNSDMSTGTTTTTSSSYTPGSALSEATHTLYVQESDAAGNWSTSGSFAIQVVTPPAAPTLATPTRYVTSLGLSWASVSGATSYNLYWSTAAGVTTASTKISNVASVYTHTPLTGGTTYYYKLAAVKSGVEGALSNEVSAAPYSYAAPTVASISPNSGSANGGTVVTITGAGFVSGATVSIGGVNATAVTFVSGTSLTAIVPAGSIGSQNVVVTNPDGQTGTLVGGFTYSNMSKVYLGGVFLSTDPDLVAVPSVARLNSNGVLDSGFTVGTGFTGVVNTIAVQSDGKILAGGTFTSYNETTIYRIARLNSNGTLDDGFNVGTGFQNTVNRIVVQSDGKILVGGGFTSYNGTSRNFIARLNSDGTLDSGFNVGTGFQNTVNTIVVQSDGKILVGGGFTSYNGTSINRIARLNSDGTLDAGFTVGTGFNVSGESVQTIAVQSDGKILVGGWFTSYNGTSRNYIARLNSDGSLDVGFAVGTGFSFTVTSIAIQSDGKILVGGGFTSYNGTTINRIARLNSNGALDAGFAVGSGFSTTVNSIAVQSDGKILVVGGFTSYNGTSRNYIANLNSDGSLDGGFTIGAGFNSSVFSLVVQSDGKILVGGQFASYNGTSSPRIAAQNIDGTLDGGFTVGAGFSSTVDSLVVLGEGKLLAGGAFTSYRGANINRIARLNSDGTLDNAFIVGTGFTSTVNSLAVHSDGKILVGGNFTSYNGTSRSRIARLNSNGSLDTGFTVGTGFNAAVNKVAVQTDGKVLVGGQFTSYNGTTVNRIARLNTDGTLDSGFAVGTGLNDQVLSLVVQNDGKILVGGWFTSYNGTSRNYIARLNSDGSLDTGFTIGTVDSAVYSMAVLSDGKILVGGGFTSYNGTSINRIARLNSDGSFDSGFNIGTGFSGGAVAALATQSDGKILVGGNFLRFNGTSRNNFARLNSDGTLDTSFAFDTSGQVRAIALRN